MFYYESDSINELNLSVRSCNALNRAGILTVGDLQSLSEEDLWKIKNLGAKSVQEILDKRARMEVDLGPKPEVDSVPETVPSFLGNDGITYQDVAIEQIDFSNRAYNCLKRENISFLSELLHLTYDEIKSWNKVGEKTVTEIIEKRDSYPLQPVFETAGTANAVQIEAQQALCRSIAKRLSNSYKVDLKSLYEQISPLCEIYFQENPAETMTEETLLENPDFIRALSASPVFANGIQGKLLSVLNKSVYGCTVKHLSEVCRPIPADTLEVNLRSLVATRQVTRNEDGAYTIKRMTAIEYAAQIPNQRRGYVLTERLHGRTLEDIGNELNVQRERIRQITDKALAQHPTLYEDRYAEVFQKYDFSRDDFRLAFQENDTVFEYLKLAYKAGDLPAEELMDDESFPIVFRRAGEHIAYKNCVQIGSTIVPCRRDALCDYALRQYAVDDISFSSFVDKYHALLSNLSIEDNPKLIISGRGYENKLAASKNVLWKHGKCLRYYPILLYDYTNLLEALDLKQYTDVEISALKLFNEHAELMREYDIRDEYELHNLLKKICTEEAYPNVQFLRMPTIEFGNFNRDQQVMDLLLSCAPISKEDFAQRYEEEYGIKAGSVMANYLGCIAAYLDGDTYRIDSLAMSDAMAQKLKGELTDDFYLLSEFHEIYRRLFPDADRGLLNSYSITNLGFRIYSNYVVSGKYHSAVEYFRHILLGQDIVDISTFKRSLLSTVTFCSQLYKLREEMEIVEFAPQRYIQIRKLNQAGIGKEDLRGFCEDVAEYVSDGEFFTVFSLQKAGFAHKLDEYGFDDWFYASVLAENKDMFSYQRTGGSRLFRKGSCTVVLSGFIENILDSQEAKSMDVYDLSDYIGTEFGLFVPTSKLIETIRESSMYYDSISQKAYLDYDIYFSEV
ncbi:DNA-directed RNA polymerase subunit alpha C-terminal domain-containing protein [Flavonifractor sp. An92]|uniref:DNA-directed RNA polymerase subunit alpha C-terminal domain-containing protein n=1 Tax=Flavonifractor sp. An92 TaxID=1965666 RepID=UPI0013022285|nr:DNA-directed RNA polymerase subunit alpha C-terminal domain-containing protein [Flavonifractor sp. An92]